MSPDDPAGFLQFATALAAAAERIAIVEYGSAEVQRKADDSEVTAADLRIQRVIGEHIRAAYADHALLGEEDVTDHGSMPAPQSARFCWVVDPIDGTRNYVRRLPAFGTSIALLQDGVPIVGVVREFSGSRTYSALRGHGAFCRGRRMAVAETPLDRRSVITFQPDEAGAAYAQAAALLPRVHVRNLGSTALHLALLADGAVDGAYARECRVWDVAAGTLLVEESGGIVTDPRGAPLFPFDLANEPRRFVPFLAATPATHGALLAAFGGRG